MPTETHEDENVYILITQCLQNSFFLSNENQLALPEETVKQMLLGTGADVGEVTSLTGETNRKRRYIDRKRLESGPMYQFLQSVIKSGQRNDRLHVINIKDWHPPSDNYDRERRQYGTHCSADSWGAQILEGFEDLLEPWQVRSSVTKATQERIAAVETISGCKVGQVTYYEVRSDTLFDFQPVQKQHFAEKDGKTATYSIEKSRLSTILDTLIGDVHEWHNRRVYCAVIGVYSDIKINTLLTGLRSRYLIQNLIVSDVLTGSPTLERHLAGLDFADKVLQVEVIHSLNELASVLHGGDFNGEIDSAITRYNIDFHDYSTYFLDKQNVLSYSDQKVSEYLDLTRRRAAHIYRITQWTNMIVIALGILTVIGGLIAALYSTTDNSSVQFEWAVITGGAGLFSLIATLFFKPLENLQENMASLVRMRNYLETYSTVNALMRHHLTIPELLSQSTQAYVPSTKVTDAETKPNDGAKTDEVKQADGRDLALVRLERQLKLIDRSSKIMRENFDDIGSRQRKDDDQDLADDDLTIPPDFSGG